MSRLYITLSLLISAFELSGANCLESPSAACGAVVVAATAVS